MQLYPRFGATAVDAGGEHYEPGDDGGFDFPAELAGHLHSTAVNGVKQWETAIERQARMLAEEADRRKDPATLLAAVERITQDDPADLKARIAELERRLAERDGETDTPAAKTPTRRGKPTA